MAVLVDEKTRILVQGITGRTGSIQTGIMLKYGANIVAGVTPGKGGMSVEGVPVFDSVAEAMRATEPNAAISFVPPAAARESLFELAENRMPLAVLTTENIPRCDVMQMLEFAALKEMRIIGPGSAGIISPQRGKLGVHPSRMFKRGTVGIVSKSGALSYEMGKTLTDAGIGQSTVIALGGGPSWGTTMRDAVELLNNDEETDFIIILGEIGGDMEQQAAAYLKDNAKKPAACLIVGRTAPAGKSLGHAGAISSAGSRAGEKTAALKQAGVFVASSPTEIARHIKDLGVQ